MLDHKPPSPKGSPVTAGVTSTLPPGAVDLYWIPLGAGAHVVRLSGKLYEATKAFIEHRQRCALCHTALVVGVLDARFVIESAPIRDQRGRERGVVAEGPVGTSWAGTFRLFRYEIRRWREGTIPDANEAVSSPVRVASDLARAQRVLDLGAIRPNPRVGPRRTAHGRHVELQLADLVAARACWRGHRPAPAAIRWSGARLGRRPPRRTTRERTPAFALTETAPVLVEPSWLHASGAVAP